MSGSLSDETALTVEESGTYEVGADDTGSIAGSGVITLVTSD